MQYLLSRGAACSSEASSDALEEASGKGHADVVKVCSAIFIGDLSSLSMSVQGHADVMKVCSAIIIGDLSSLSMSVQGHADVVTVIIIGDLSSRDVSRVSLFE